MNLFNTQSANNIWSDIRKLVSEENRREAAQSIIIHLCQQHTSRLSEPVSLMLAADAGIPVKEPSHAKCGWCKEPATWGGLRYLSKGIQRRYCFTCDDHIVEISDPEKL